MHNRGTFCNGMLNGTVVEIDPQDSSVREVHYKDGAPFGTYRHRRMDGQLLGYGKLLGDVKVEASTNRAVFSPTSLLRSGPSWWWARAGTPSTWAAWRGAAASWRARRCSSTPASAPPSRATGRPASWSGGSTAPSRPPRYLQRRG